MPIHVAITRRVRPGCEAEFQEALRGFFQESFGHQAVLGATLIVPPPGSASREFGILRTFRDEQERDAFYASPLYLAWEARARALTEGEPAHRPLHGLEAWFRTPTPPPRWKMAVVTYAGVYTLTLLLGLTLSPHLRGLPLPVANAVFNAVVVPALTWAVMPGLTRLFRRWLHPA